MTIRPTGPCPARIMIVGEAPTELDVKRGVPFSDQGGDELGRMLREAGIPRESCFITMACRERPPGNKVSAFFAEKKKEITAKHILVRDRFVLPVVRDGMEILAREIELVQPNVIIAVGNAALWALTGKWGITSWRGSLLEVDLPVAVQRPVKVIPIYPPNFLFRQWSWRPVAVHDLRRAAKEAKTDTLIRPDYRFVTRPDYSTATSVLLQLYQQLDSAESPMKLSVDIETRAGHIACIAIAWSTREALCIPLMSATTPDGYWPIEQETALVFALYQILTHKNCLVIGQNFLYDAQYIYRHWHFLPTAVRDTMIGQHSLFAGMRKGLDYLSSMYCEHHVYWKDEGKEWGPHIDENQLWEYNCKDAVITMEAHEALEGLADKLQLREVYDFQQSLFFPVLRTVLKGLRLDVSSRMDFAMLLQEEMASRERWFIAVLGSPINCRSPLQMQNLFYEDFKQKPVINRKTGNPSCDDEALSKIAAREPLLRQLCERILEFRSLSVFFSTFVSAPPDVDGRMRCTFDITGTETYRFSSSKNAFGTGLNLQNIPSGGDEGSGLELPNIRKLFIPDPGYTFFDIDLSAADLRIVVWESDEPEMKDMLRQGLDPYTEIAKEFYHDQSITKKDPRRQTFKAFAHGTHYFGTPSGMADILGLPVHDVERTQKWYFERFPRIKAWQNDLKDQVFKRHMVQNVFGYRWYILDRIEGTIINQAAAWIPQSTVACLINRAYVAIDRDLPEVDILLQVHDSLAGQFPSHLGEWMEKQIVEKASIALPYPGDPLTIPVGLVTSTKSWGGCKE